MLNIREEEEGIEASLQWAIESESRIGSDSKKSLRKLDERKKALTSELEELRSEAQRLEDIIRGRTRPSAVDLPAEEAEDFKTKLRLKIKGVRGVAIEKAKEDLLAVREGIHEVDESMGNLSAEGERIRKKQSEARSALADLMGAIRSQRSLIRKIASTESRISSMTHLFGYYEPYALGRKIFDEIRLTRARLAGYCQSVEKRRLEVLDLERQIEALKDELRSALGEAYEASFIPIVFKDGTSPEGRRFLQNELTLADVESLGLASKIQHPKFVHRKADRLSSAVWDRRLFISEELIRMARLCELKRDATHLLSLSKRHSECAQKILEAKVQLLDTVLAVAESCAELEQLESSYQGLRQESAAKKERALGAVQAFGSDL